MPRNDRIPEGVRKEINKIAPGKYLDPSTGRVYVDSADMDDALDEMLDRAENTREERRKAIADQVAEVERVPEEIRDLADERVQQMAHQVLATETVAWGKKRLQTLRGKEAWLRSQGEDLDEEDRWELETLEAELAIAQGDDHGHGSREADSGTDDEVAADRSQPE